VGFYTPKLVAVGWDWTECRSDVVLSTDNSQYKHLTVDQKVLLDAFVEKVFPVKK